MYPVNFRSIAAGFPAYTIKIKTEDDQKSEILKLHILRNSFGADLAMQKENVEPFAEMCRKWGNSGLFAHKK